MTEITLEKLLLNNVADEGCRSMLRTLLNEPHRHYHNAKHIEYMATHADYESFPETYHGSPQSNLMLMILYHDAIYYPQSKFNEELSEMLYRNHASGSHRQPSYYVSQGILASKNHLNPDHKTLPIVVKHFLDLDLLGLADTAVFRENSRNIMKEFVSNLSDLANFMHGRRRWLQSIISKRINDREGEMFWFPQLLPIKDADAQAMENIRYEYEIIRQGEDAYLAWLGQNKEEV